MSLIPLSYASLTLIKNENLSNKYKKGKEYYVPYIFKNKNVIFKIKINDYIKNIYNAKTQYIQPYPLISFSLLVNEIKKNIEKIKIIKDIEIDIFFGLKKIKKQKIEYETKITQEIEVKEIKIKNSIYTDGYHPEFSPEFFIKDENLLSISLEEAKEKLKKYIDMKKLNDKNIEEKFDFIPFKYQEYYIEEIKTNNIIN